MKIDPNSRPFVVAVVSVVALAFWLLIQLSPLMNDGPKRNDGCPECPELKR